MVHVYSTMNKVIVVHYIVSLNLKQSVVHAVTVKRFLLICKYLLFEFAWYRSPTSSRLETDSPKG